MRKHKSVVAILLAVMMIFTFMPAMAFADDALDTYQTQYQGQTVDWGTDFTTAKIGNNDPVSTTITADSNGLIKASVVVNGVDTATAYFYDLQGSKLFRSASAEVKDNYTYAGYTGLFGPNLYVLLAKPSYVATWTNTAAVDPVNYSITANGTADAKADKGEVKTITTKVTADRFANGGSERPFLLNASAVPGATVTITDGNTGATSGWYIDSIATDNAVPETGLVYDGKEHTLVYNQGSYAVSYKKYDRAEGRLVSVNAITYKDVVAAADADAYVATWKDGRNRDQFSWFTLTVAPSAKRPAFAFKANTAATYKMSEAEAAEPAKFVELTANNFEASDEAELMKYFNDLYEVKVVKGSVNNGVETQTWTISPKYTTVKDVTAAEKPYKTLLTNYGWTASTAAAYFTANVTAQNVTVAKTGEENINDDDISFEGQTKYVYSGKKTTKKGVLKAKKTITVKAAADSGNAITYVATKTTSSKITVSKAGKITVKKGLKKGTYKVTVKAKTAAGNGYKAASEKQTYTIVIKK